MARIRVALVADIHHGRDTLTKKGTSALPLLEQFIAEIKNGDFDAVIDLGDRISDESVDRDRELLTAVAERFAGLDIPRHHVNGNHDRAMLSQTEIEAVLDRPTGSRAARLGDIRLVFWQPDVTLTRERSLRLEPNDLVELTELLDADDRPTLLISHVPLSGHVQTGNYYFERNPHHATYAEVDQIRGVVAHAPCPIVALAGHVHWNTLTIVDGTPHITLQSLTETFTSGKPAGATSVLEIESETLRWTVRGHDSLSLTLPWPAAKRRWTNPLPPFDELMEDPKLVSI